MKIEETWNTKITDTPFVRFMMESALQRGPCSMEAYIEHICTKMGTTIKDL
jgi:hypothetical protein